MDMYIHVRAHAPASAPPLLTPMLPYQTALSQPLIHTRTPPLPGDNVAADMDVLIGAFLFSQIRVFVFWYIFQIPLTG